MDNNEKITIEDFTSLTNSIHARIMSIIKPILNLKRYKIVLFGLILTLIMSFNSVRAAPKIFIIFFSPRSPLANSTSQIMISQIISDWQLNPRGKVIVLAHSRDETADDQRLADVRAENIARALVAGGVSPRSIIVSGTPKTTPPTGTPADRFVEVTISD